MTESVISPFDAFLANRGLKILDIRMDKHCKNAAILADFFLEHPAYMAHSTYTTEELKEAGISEGLVNISVGLECINDLIEAFKKGLDGLY